MKEGVAVAVAVDFFLVHPVNLMHCFETCDMENLHETSQHDNSKLIYEHAEKCVDKINKSIDNITTKLTTSIGFSGVLLKFASDMPSGGYSFFFKICVTLLLMGAIGFCACGLYPKQAGDSLTTRYLREELYYYPDEEIRRLIIDQKLRSIDQLNDLAKFRRTYLNCAISCLMIATGVFGVSVIVETFPAWNG